MTLPEVFHAEKDRQSRRYRREVKLEENWPLVTHWQDDAVIAVA